MPRISKGSFPESGSDAPSGPQLPRGHIPRDLSGSKKADGFQTDEDRIEAIQAAEKLERDYSAARGTATRAVQRQQQDQQEERSVEEVTEEESQQDEAEKERRNAKLQRVVSGDDPEQQESNYGGSEGTSEEDALRSKLFSDPGSL